MSDATQDRVIAPDFAGTDVAEKALRPQTLSDFVGQQAVRENLSVFIAAARSRDEALDHTIFFGPPGLGENDPCTDRCP